MLVRMIGISMMNMIQRMTEIGGKRISSAPSLPPDGSKRNIVSQSSSPVVMVITLSSDRGTPENGERCNNQQITYCMSCMYTILCIQQCKCTIHIYRTQREIFVRCKILCFSRADRKRENYCHTHWYFTCKTIGGCGFLVLKQRFKISAEGSRVEIFHCTVYDRFHS